MAAVTQTARRLRGCPSPCMDVCRYELEGHCTFCSMTKAQKAMFGALKREKAQAQFIAQLRAQQAELSEKAARSSSRAGASPTATSAARWARRRRKSKAARRVGRQSSRCERSIQANFSWTVARSMAKSLVMKSPFSSARSASAPKAPARIS
jgi:predicted Fe-S protein YdhL (DUF1289 family)